MIYALAQQIMEHKISFFIQKCPKSLAKRLKETAKESHSSPGWMAVGVTAAKVGKVRFGRDIALTTQPATNSAANNKMRQNNKADQTVHRTTEPVRSKEISQGCDKNQNN